MEELKIRLKNWILRTFFAKEIVRINRIVFNNGVHCIKRNIKILEYRFDIDENITDPNIIYDLIENKAKVEFFKNISKYIEVRKVEGKYGNQMHPHIEYSLKLKIIE